MKQIIFVLLLCPFFSSAQRDQLDSIFIKSIPANLGKPIHMPEISYNPDFNLDKLFTHRERIRIFPIGDDSVYHKLFGRYVFTKDSLKKYREMGVEDYYYRFMEQYLVDSIPVIDFSKNVLIVYSACAKCLEVCNHNEGSQSCHRAACDFREAWFIKEKEPLFVQKGKAND